MRNKRYKTEKRKVATVYDHMLHAVILYVTIYILYLAIWPILLLVIHCIADDVSEIDRFSEIWIKIKFSQMVN